MNGNTVFATTTLSRAPPWIANLLKGAARHAPPSLSERLAEEWLSDYAQQRGLLDRLRFVCGCYWAAMVISHEIPLGVPVPACLHSIPQSAAGHRSPRGTISSFSRASATSNTVMSEMNITPLIDVMLVLLVTLIVSLPTMTHAVKLDLPRGTSVETRQPPIIDLEIDSDGTIAWNGTVLTGLQQLETYLRAEAQRDPQAEIHLRPERRAKYDVVAQVLASAQRSRIAKMAFANTGEFAN